MREGISDKDNTFLAFKGQPRHIEEIVSEIEKVARKSDCFIDDEIVVEGDKDKSLDSSRWFVDRISINLPLKEGVYNELSKTLPEYDGKNNLRNGEDHLYLSFKRYWESNVPIQDYWYLNVFGKETCSKEYFHFALNSDSYEMCRCPDNFKNFCKDLGSIINTYSIKKL